MAVLNVPVRWHPTATPPEIPSREPNFTYREAIWPIPVDQAALVLIDCWDSHPVESHLENSGQIIAEVLRPTVEACRAAGLAIVHAPSPQQARLYPQWLRYAGDSELGSGPPSPPTDPWPPAEFRQRTGPYAAFERVQYLRPVEPYVANRRIVPELEPQPDDFVVATGAQLHRLARHRGVLHLFFAGFAANMCVLYRDYGIKAMSERGYSCILLRDATVAIEAAHTYNARALTEAACVTVEMLWGVTTTAQALSLSCIAP